jgi:hypothetical protein
MDHVRPSRRELLGGLAAAALAARLPALETNRPDARRFSIKWFELRPETPREGLKPHCPPQK